MDTDTNNPYSTPDAETLLSSQTPIDHRSYFVEGKHLVVSDGAELPNLCIKTGEPLPNGKRRKKTLYWAHPAWALLILLGLLVYIIVYLCVRKKVTIHYSISAAARRKRLLASLSCLLLVFGSIGGIAYFVISDNPAFIGASVLLLLIGLVITSVVSNFPRVKKHRNGWFVLSGPGKAFLDAVQATQANTQAKPPNVPE